MNYLDFVNVRMGTDTVPRFSNGNTQPMTSMPFGMNNFIVETRGYGTYEIFNATDRVTTGIRLTHCSNRWLGDYGHFTFMPRSDDAREAIGNFTCFRPEETVMSPHEIIVDFQLQRAKLHLVPTERGAIGRVKYTHSDGTKRFYICLTEGAKLEIDAKNNRIVGYTRCHYNEVPDNFALYFVIDFDRKIDLQKTQVFNKEREEITCENHDYTGNTIMANIAFEGDINDYEIRLASSFISIEQAVVNLNREIIDRSFEDIRKTAVGAWESILSKIEIDADDEIKKTFYSCLYRMFLFPRTFYEFDSEGKMIHYSPANGNVLEGVMYTDNGFWDTYKTVYPLYSIVLSDKYREMCEGFLNFYKESGWLPRWLNPGAVDCMPGTSIDNVFADAVEKGIVTDKKDIELMLESMMKHANTASPVGKYGREGIEDYVKYHYVPSEHLESVNKTQDYAYGDFSIAKIAQTLGKTDIAQKYFERSKNYQNIFDTKETFMRARNKQGQMREDWTQFDWGGDYTEGGPWQNSFAVFHDFHGLANLMGGRDAMIKKLDKLFDTPPYFNCYGYRHLIHEMSEMASVDFGQCALSNQPSFHIPYLYAYMGEKNKTAYWVRKALRELFNSSASGYPGDEDNGSTSGWYVFSALGFYPVCPTVPQYVIGSPAVKKAVIHTDSGTDFVIRAEENTDETVYWKSAWLNGQELKTTYINHNDIKNGGTLCFEMSSEPYESSYEECQLPYSLSKDEK